MSYTPIPLFTVGADYKAGTGDNTDLSVTASMTYQFGTPLTAQLDPENVKTQHSLAGSRTDFVDRNNFIILEYREKDPLDVTLWLKADETNENPECVIQDKPEAGIGTENASGRSTLSLIIATKLLPHHGRQRTMLTAHW